MPRPAPKRRTQVTPPSPPPPPPAAAEVPQRSWIRHELRTPVNHIIGYSEMIEEEAAEGLARSFLSDIRKIKAGGRHLLELINQFFGDDAPPGPPARTAELFHELRTPVNHIAGYAELLTEQAAEQGRSELGRELGRIRDAALRWLALMEEHLNLAPAKPAEPRPARPVSALEAAAPAETTSHDTLFLGKAKARRTLKARVLVVDDDESNRDLLARHLRRLGHQVATAAGGAEALERLRKEKHDLLLLDLLMPGLSGAQVLVELKRDPALRHLPVIMISALDDQQGIVSCIELGAEDYVAKPLNPVFLKARMNAVLEKKRLRDREQQYLRQIQGEREKSDRLLLNVLPAPIAERLKKGETSIADQYPEVTVLFADLVGFTALSAVIEPAEVVRLLNEVFTAFDFLAAKHGLEKIKTIGDAYMAVAGLPVPRQDHASAAALMALAMQREIEDFNLGYHTSLRMRVGLNSGPVIAGIIGRNKFIYDLWGDTVNVASRMESMGVPGAIQVTDATRELLENHFRFEKRGPLQVKGRGAMAAWLLLGPTEGSSKLKDQSSKTGI